MSIFYKGNTYYFGATAPAKTGSGSVNYVFTGLTLGATYGFVVLAFNAGGTSDFAGPSLIFTKEVRDPIQVFAWDWPNSPVYTSSTPSSITSTNSNNLFPLSNQIIVSEIWPSVTSSNIGKNQNPGSCYPPNGIDPYAISAINNGDYVGIYNVQQNLKSGNTYTYSFYHNVSSGITGLSYRIIVESSNSGGIPVKQIAPVADASYTSTNITTGEKSLNYGSGLTGWQRFALNFIPGSTQTNLKIYVISKNFSIGGVSAYIGGPQLVEGDTLSSFIETGAIPSWEGNCAAQGYIFDDDRWLEESTVRGWTYISPMVNFSGIMARKPYFTTGWTMAPIVQRAAKLLKGLPNKKRSILPVYFFTEVPWFHNNDGISFDHGTTYTFYNDLYNTKNTQKLFPTIWPQTGISMAQAPFTDLMKSFAATGATVDYLISNMELFGSYSSFNIIGYTAFKQIMVGLTQYGNSYLGLTSFKDWMASEGATISNIGWSDQISKGPDYLVWEGIQRAYINRALEKIYSEIETQFPNATKLEYEWSYLSGGDPLDGAPDINGHPQWFKYTFGNAAAPQIYGWMGGIASGVYGVCGADPTYLYYDAGGGKTLPAKNEWTSFVMGLQTVRSAKRGAPNTPITPWIASVRFPGGAYAYAGGSADAPQVGFADMSLGFNPWQGVTINSKPGNTAYYYEMVKHVALHGVKAFPYWNSYSFMNESSPVVVPGNTYANTVFSGDEGYQRDMDHLNGALIDINEKLGGFTLTTADSSRISWIAPYVASGAPGLNGTTWWWRVTVNPQYNILVNGITLNGSSGPWGTWVGTTGATLTGVGITVL